MEYVVMGGDARMAHLARLLSERGKRVGVFGLEGRAGVPTVDAEALARARNVVVNCPPKLAGQGMTFAEMLATVGEDARVFACGPWHPGAGNGRVIDLWADEALIRENARLTAEGALASAMQASECAIGDMRCMVVGWGRIGRALTEQLVALGAGVTVLSRSPAGRNRAVERGAEAVDTAMAAAVLPGHRLIFNTAPALVLDEAALERADRNAMLVDLASPSYGIDLAAAWKHGLRAWREPGLPGRYCPESAARVLLDAISRHGL